MFPFMPYGVDSKGKMSKSKQAKFENDMEAQNLFQNYLMLALTQFEWEGLPDTCDPRMLEMCLLYRGQAMIVDDGGYMTLGSTPGSGITAYGYPSKAWGWGWNGLNKEYRVFVPGSDAPLVMKNSDGSVASDQPQAVVCYDNITAYPYINYITTYSMRLADLIRSTDVVARNLKRPWVITCEESEVNSVKAALDKRDNNEAVILGSKISALDNIKVLNTATTPDTLSHLWEQFRRVEGYLLEILGFNSNANFDKSERLLTDEINSNNQVINRNAQKRLEQRQLFCERINKLWGLNVSVKLKEGGSDFDGELYDPDRVSGQSGESD